VQRESIALGHPLQIRVRAIQGADGSDHERFLTLLWANGDSVGDGTAQDLWHGIGGFSGFEFQTGLLGILLPALPFQATGLHGFLVVSARATGQSLFSCLKA
jgi:hypothetical protein